MKLQQPLSDKDHEALLLALSQARDRVFETEEAHTEAINEVARLKEQLRSSGC